MWGGSWYIPDLKTAGFDGKYGVFPEPTITSATTSYALNTITRVSSEAQRQRAVGRHVTKSRQHDDAG